MTMSLASLSDLVLPTFFAFLAMFMLAAVAIQRVLLHAWRMPHQETVLPALVFGALVGLALVALLSTVVFLYIIAANTAPGGP